VAAPTFVSASTYATSNGSNQSANNGGTTIVTTIPTNQADDIAVLGLGCNGSTTFSQPTDWNLLGTSLESNAGQSTEWYWKRMTGSDTNPSSTTSVTASNTVGTFGRIWLFRGCITTGNPFEGVGNAGTAAETTPDGTACVTTGADRFVVCLTQLDLDTAWSSGHPPATWDVLGTRSTTTVGGNYASDAIGKTVASATTVAAPVVGTLAASIRWRTITFALIPAASEQTGTVAETQDNQTSTASGVLGYTGTVARTQANQTSTASGQSAITGISARTQANQTAAGSGWILIVGTSARTQADQTSSASGTVGSPPITGTLARTQDNQIATAAGWIQITGTVAETQESQTAVAAGTVSGVLSTKHLLSWTSDPHLLPWSSDAHLLATISDPHQLATTSDPHRVAATSDSHLLVVED